MGWKKNPCYLSLAFTVKIMRNFFITVNLGLCQQFGPSNEGVYGTAIMFAAYVKNNLEKLRKDTKINNDMLFG